MAQIGNSHCAHLIEEQESRGLFCPLEPKHLLSVIGKVKSYSFGSLYAKNEGCEHSVIYQIIRKTVVT